MSIKKKTFEELFTADAESIREATKPQLKKQMMRKFDSALDDAEIKLTEIDLQEQKELLKLEKVDINELVRLDQDRIIIKENIATLKRHKDNIFAKPEDVETVE